ncbi:MAG: hypothetical protein K2I80_00980 [Ruminococcus sp.]|nr:hypothetical protein [Ruminococcus sp.]
MKKVKINDFKFFHNAFGREYYYYFRLNNSSIVSRDELKSAYGFDDSLLSDLWELWYFYDIIPVFSVNNDEILLEYLRNMKSREIDRIIKYMTGDELWLWFYRRWEIDRSFSDWEVYSENKIIKLAVEWCKNYNIPYMKGEDYEHN